MNGAYTILQKELRDAARSRWLAGFALTFALMTLAFSLAQGASDGAISQGFTRTTAGLVNLVLLLVPLLALVLGSGAIAGERDRGTLPMLLSQPVSPVAVLAGKYLGLVLSIWMAIALGFGVAGLLLALVNPLTDVTQYLQFVLLAALLAAATLSIGLLISVLTATRMASIAMSIVAWFLLVLVYDIGAIALALTVSASGDTLLLATLANPVEGVRILAVIGLQPDLRVLGPLGAYLVNEVGTGTTVMLLLGALVMWTAAPLILAARIFRGQDY